MSNKKYKSASDSIKSFGEYSKDMMEELHKTVKMQALMEAEQREKQLMKELLIRIIEEEPYEWILW